ncbi:glycosyltransferase family 4 protein [Pseudomonas sp. PDM18]|uniref:glycosyltransferase family 4 protein n=1 Tax=unclassified Pseudomonas TaxID=196821 RepID=UPI00177F2E6D|nr:glycosyltransferase family 1 protein [Pseudomonas sp. PDM18]MBD9678445.1 glycosyltransferase family 4 protein [Pseudomonas sp. PDM18]
MKRPVIGIPFNYDESWIGGTYYIKNLVSSLNLIAPAKQPDVWIISHSETSFEFIQKGTGYPRLNWIKPGQIDGIDGGISRKAKLLSLLTPRFWKRQLNFDLIFPYPIDTRLQQTACWIPDFQDKRLPEFFSADELQAREAQHRSYFNDFRHVVFSSNAARMDFEEFYPEADVQKYVVHFATFEPMQPELAPADVLSRYQLPERFYYCPNQFWIHKNHDTVIDAVKILKARGVEVVVAFSGKEHDHRAPDHCDKLRNKVAQAGLGENVRFLGFIPREDQMVIFRHATCIVQPSLFEGWSTVIEDAKSVSQYVIASSLPANVEQADENIEFFDATDSTALAALLEKYAKTPPARKALDYGKYQQEFADSFMGVVHSVMNTPKP